MSWFSKKPLPATSWLMWALVDSTGKPVPGQLFYSEAKAQTQQNRGSAAFMSYEIRRVRVTLEPTDAEPSA